MGHGRRSDDERRESVGESAGAYGGIGSDKEEQNKWNSNAGGWIGGEARDRTQG